ncbi:hypothetical protein CPC08DRAFT_480561 [Agrocybe pediades]|nr:hypothetical protein CPC08DRAFT_480561 [Agrocybe pediades]
MRTLRLKRRRRSNFSTLGSVWTAYVYSDFLGSIYSLEKTTTRVCGLGFLCGFCVFCFDGRSARRKLLHAFGSRGQDYCAPFLCPDGLQRGFFFRRPHLCCFSQRSS